MLINLADVLRDKIDVFIILVVYTKTQIPLITVFWIM